MSSKNGSNTRRTYYAIGNSRSAKKGFREIEMPGGDKVRILSGGVYSRAASAGGKKLREFVGPDREKLPTR